jgi:nitroimidazol reductase NimA-like FMN-containing flavoprotein (pyridoxamine 5'-phosphate oxidase superfamily)
MLETMKALVKEKDTCVLATAHDNRPHCSLMSYVTDAQCTTIFMVTHRQTKKYRNLTENPCVSILIDTREGDPRSDRSNTKALTVTGDFQRLHDQTLANSVRGGLLAKHPHLGEFLEDPDAEVFAVRIKSFQLLEGIKDSSFVEVDNG